MGWGGVGVGGGGGAAQLGTIDAGGEHKRKKEKKKLGCQVHHFSRSGSRFENRPRLKDTTKWERTEAMIVALWMCLHTNSWCTSPSFPCSLPFPLDM